MLCKLSNDLGGNLHLHLSLFGYQFNNMSLAIFVHKFIIAHKLVHNEFALRERKSK
jgi:hypothetical protein